MVSKCTSPVQLTWEMPLECEDSEHVHNYGGSVERGVQVTLREIFKGEIMRLKVKKQNKTTQKLFAGFLIFILHPFLA